WPWLAIATSAAHCGAPALVPPTTSQSAWPATGTELKTANPVRGSALYATSGLLRPTVTVEVAGAAKWVSPSAEPKPYGAAPTERTLGDVAGHCGPDQAPSSPDAATNVTPVCPVGVVKLLSRPISWLNSPAPQLIDTTDTPAVLRAVSTAVIRSGSVGEFAST